MYILGISAYYHDSAACLLKDDNIVCAVQEERFTRIKNDAAFPHYSIICCLKQADISLNQVDYVVYYEKPFLKFERLLETHIYFSPKGLKQFLKSMPVWLKEKLYFKKMLINNLKKIDSAWKYSGSNLLFTDHHEAHAASAFYPSPFKEAIVLTVDGVGEWQTTTVGRAVGNNIESLKQINFPHSVGLLYSAFTYYLGFKVNCDEYKVMGLAPFGKPAYVKLILDNLVDVKEDGTYRLNMHYLNYGAGLTMTGKNFDDLFKSVPRKPGDKITNFHMDMACSIQSITEFIMLRLTQSLYKQYKMDNLCLAGGVALNCVINGKIMKQSGFKNVWVQPASGDAGGALGAAFAVYYKYLNNLRIAGNDRMNNAMLGASYTNSEIEQVLITHQLKFEKLNSNTFYDNVAKEIATGKVIGYFKGKMEFGPRALGARSIIADPRDPQMQSRINQKIKFRESFRPFAAAVIEQHAHEYFDLGAQSPYMLMVGNVHTCKLVLQTTTDVCKDLNIIINQVRSVIPAVTHVDNTCRLQTVNPENNPDFYRIVEAFYKLTGCPMVINTSFNRMDEPIVCTPYDAVQCFLNTDIDRLVIEGYMIIKDAIN